MTKERICDEDLTPAALCRRDFAPGRLYFPAASSCVFLGRKHLDFSAEICYYI